MAKPKNREHGKGISSAKTDRVAFDEDVALVRIFRNGTCAAWDTSRTQVRRFSELSVVEVWPDLKRHLTTDSKVFVQKILDGWVPITDDELAALDKGLSPTRAVW